MKALKSVIGAIIIVSVLAVYAYGFVSFPKVGWTVDILFPATIISLGGFAMLGCIWFVRYRGKEMHR